MIWKFYACYLVFYNLMLLFYILAGANNHYDIRLIFYTFYVGLDLSQRGCTVNILLMKFKQCDQNLVSIVFPFQAYQIMQRQSCVNWDLVHKGGPWIRIVRSIWICKIWWSGGEGINLCVLGSVEWICRWTLPYASSCDGSNCIWFLCCFSFDRS